MTLTDLMDHLADFIKPVITEYATKQGGNVIPLGVYAGYPPQEKEHNSFIYILVTDVDDDQEGDMSTAKVQIGFSIYDDDKKSTGRSLFNLVEHVRQHLLKHRTVADEHRLILPLKFNLAERPWPQWQAILTATYTIGQPCEEVFYDEQERISTY